MFIYIVDEQDIHTPITCKETNYIAVPRVGEKIICDGQLYEVTTVYHNLDVQEIKIVTRKILLGD